MTKEQFNTWKNAYFAAFPDALSWLNKLENPAGTLATWFKCLAHCEYADVALATDKMTTGDLAPIEAFQREQTALHVKAYAGRIADDRAKREKAEREHQRFVDGKRAVRRESGPSTASMFKQILKIRAEGAAKGLEGGSLNLYASDELGKWLERNSDRVAVGASADCGEDR